MKVLEWLEAKLRREMAEEATSAEKIAYLRKARSWWSETSRDIVNLEPIPDVGRVTAPIAVMFGMTIEREIEKLRAA